MSLLFYIILILIIILLFILLKNKSVSMTIFFSILIIIIIINPKVCINAAITGAVLFFNKVFPSLFPFLVLSGLILAYDGIKIYAKLLGPILCRPLHLPESCSFVLIISALCGYPLGAKYACDLYEDKVIDRNTCERLINIASNPSPLFIIGAVGTSMLGNLTLGYILLISTYLSCFFMGVIIPHKHNNAFIAYKARADEKSNNFGSAIKESIDNASKTCITICGFVTLFSVLNSMLKSSMFFNTASAKLCNIFNLPLNLFQGTFLGIIEMTNGCNDISLIHTSLKVKIVIISFLLAFSGISVIFQVYSFTYKHNFPLKNYILLKFIQGIISSCISFILINVTKVNKSLPLLNINTDKAFGDSFYLMILLLLFIVLPFLTYKFLNKLFNSF